MKRINDAGGVNGRPIEVLIEDDATDEAKAVAAATKLIEQDKVIAILGATGTGQTMAMRGDVERAGIPQVSMAGGTVVTGRVRPARLPDAVVQHASSCPSCSTTSRTQGNTKIAVHQRHRRLRQGRPGGRSRRRRRSSGITIVADETFNPGDTDMTRPAHQDQDDRRRGGPPVDRRQGRRDHR